MAVGIATRLDGPDCQAISTKGFVFGASAKQLPDRRVRPQPAWIDKARIARRAWPEGYGPEGYGPKGYGPKITASDLGRVPRIQLGVQDVRW